MCKPTLTKEQVLQGFHIWVEHGIARFEPTYLIEKKLMPPLSTTYEHWLECSCFNKMHETENDGDKKKLEWLLNAVCDRCNNAWKMDITDYCGRCAEEKEFEALGWNDANEVDDL